MEAVVFKQAGEPNDVLACAETSAPVPHDEDVLVKVTARPIHPADLAFIRGQYRLKPSFPQVAGLEGVGVIIAGRPTSPLFALGQRVAFRCPGTWAEIVRVPQDRLISVPSDIPDAIACQISLNPLTAVGLLEEAAVKRGDWLLLTAATSTVSNLIASIAHGRGVKVIGLARDAARAAAARSRADHIISVNDPNLTAALTSLSAGHGIEALLDSVGGPILPKLFGTLSAGARVIAYGVQDREPAAVTNAMLIYSNLTWKGFGIDRWLTQISPTERARIIDELWSMIRAKTLDLPIATTFPLSQFNKALTANGEAGRNGKVLLVS
jgi:NADPH:quinone reductase